MSVTIRSKTRGVWMAAIIVAACSAGRESNLDHSYVEKIVKHPNVVITAPRELIGATLTIDDSGHRMLWPDTLIDRSCWRFWRRLLGTQSTPSAAKAYLELPPGEHVLVITHAGYQKIVKEVNLRFEQQSVEVRQAELVPEKKGTADVSGGGRE